MRVTDWLIGPPEVRREIRAYNARRRREVEAQLAISRARRDAGKLNARMARADQPSTTVAVLPLPHGLDPFGG